MITKNTYKYGYSGYGIGFDICLQFSWSHCGWGKSFIISGCDMNSSVHVNHKNKKVFVLSEDPIQALDDTTLTAKAK